MSSPVKRGDEVVMTPPPDGVCCRACEYAALAHLSPMARMIKRSFIVCTTCGHKRCPKATNHELDCTNSNATGQEGSYYK